jgi:ribosome recycling factor
MNKIRNLIVAGKQVKEYEKAGTIMINMNGQRSIRVDSIDAVNGPKLYKQLTTALMEAGMTVLENGSSLIANMQQLTEDMRKELSKQIRVSKENYKQSLNNLRSDMNKIIKNAKLSEDIQARIKIRFKKA